ncbi:MAG: hypothetical protein WA771_00810 [Chthoniobacterales bacterium]
MILPAVAIGFHGCDQEVGERILSGKSEIRPSDNPYDWLGWGAYFWEGDPHRAKSWAEFLCDQPQASRSKIAKPFVIGAIINLGLCLDLTHAANLDIVRAGYHELSATYQLVGTPMPENAPAAGGDADLVRRFLDCAVFNYIHDTRKLEDKQPFNTVRAAFPEGGPLYAGSKISEKSHVQICVRDPKCVLGYFRPIWDRYA